VVSTHPAGASVTSTLRQSPTRRSHRLQALAVVAVPLGTLAAVGGAYSSATLPVLAAAAAAFLISGARVGVGANRRLDWALVALVAGAALQLAPLPASIVDAISPSVNDLRTALYFAAAADGQPLSVNPHLTRAGVASLASALLVFWAAREVFGRGGTRRAARAIAWAGFAVVLVTLIQRATSPNLLLWTWTPADRESQPFGPFVNRNHLATWLLMAASLTAGYLVSHTQAITSSYTSLRLRIRDWLADGNGLVLAGALLAMVVGLAATLSRSAILGALAALTLGGRAAGGGRRATTRLVAGSLAVLLLWGVWVNRNALASKFDGSGAVGRPVIWRQTLPVMQDFWLAGTGIGTFGPAMLRYQTQARDVHFNQAHNEYLQLAAEGGLLLVVPAALALAAGLSAARRRLRDDTRAMVWTRLGAAAGLLGVAVQGLFETGLRVPANALLAAVLAAIVLHEPQDR
jgi:hypothetical protein